MPNNVISEINPTGEVGGEYKLKDSVARGLFFESEDDYEEAVSQGLLNDLPDGTMIYTPSTGGGGGGGGSTTVVEELSDIEAMTVFNGEAAGAKAVKTLKQAFSDALTALKNTAIAQAVGATGSTFTAVINKLAEIVNNGDTSKTITAGTSNKTSSIPAGYTSGGTITVSPTPSQTKTVTASRSDQTVTPDSGKLLSQVTVNKFPDASGSFSIAGDVANINGNHDMGATNNYRYVSLNAKPHVDFYVNFWSLGNSDGCSFDLNWIYVKGWRVLRIIKSYNDTSNKMSFSLRGVDMNGNYQEISMNNTSTDYWVEIWNYQYIHLSGYRSYRLGTTSYSYHILVYE